MTMPCNQASPVDHGRCELPTGHGGAHESPGGPYRMTYRWYGPRNQSHGPAVITGLDEPTQRSPQPVNADTLAAEISTAIYGADHSTNPTDPRAIKTRRAAANVLKLIERSTAS